MGAMMLGDMGADVIRVDRPPVGPDSVIPPRYLVHERSRRSIVVDLHKPEGARVVLRLVASADGLIDPFRPGVAERLGIGPDPCLAVNKRLVYARMTGWGQDGAGLWTDERGVNLLDSGAPFYNVYETSDGKYVSIGPIEPRFYALLLEKVGLAAEELPLQMDRRRWPDMKRRFERIFKARTRDEWCRMLEGTD